jgi:NAD+ synthase
MADRLRIAAAQLNPIVGDLAYNVALIREARAEAGRLSADLLVTPELVLSGYPPEDLVRKPDFLASVRAHLDELAADTLDNGPAVLLGTPLAENGRVYNCAVLLDGGRIAAIRQKFDLPNYGVFDEKRVFAAGPLPGPINFRDVRLGVMVCEDMWTPEVTEYLQESGAEILIVLNGSPYEQVKAEERLSLGLARVTESGLPLIYVNQIGGQDELVFDGGSFALSAERSLVQQLGYWRPACGVTEWIRDNGSIRPRGPAAIEPASEGLEAIYQAMVLGLRDYVNKNCFPGILLGLSGGIDSALCAAIATDALGPERVHCVMMPSPYTSADSLEDAALCANLLGIRLDTVAIEPAMEAFGLMLEPYLAETSPGVTEENLQSRSRGMILMALSNKFGAMVLSTGNKSEMAVGYATLYGDMCGGYAVLKDLYKTKVFEVSAWRNEHRPAGALGPDGPVMPLRVITKPPSAELKPNQTDQDTLPPYDVLDGILCHLIERETPLADIIADGFDEATVRRVWQMLDRAEYKRRQAPPGVKLIRRAFGRDRRYPITNGFRPS